MAERIPCEEVVDNRASRSRGVHGVFPCPNRAKLRVECVGWTKNLCGVHGRYYATAKRVGGRQAEWIVSVTEIPK